METIFDATPDAMTRIRSAIKAEDMIRVAIAFCSCFALAGFLTLHLSTAKAQDRASASERVAVAEGRVEAAQANIARMEVAITNLQKEVSDGREKVSELNSKLSQVYGVGMGLASIMLILQAAQMLIPRVTKSRKDQEE